MDLLCTLTTVPLAGGWDAVYLLRRWMMTIGDTKQEHFTRPKEEYDRLIAVARAAKAAYVDGVVRVTHIHGENFYMVPDKSMDKILSALAAVEDLL
jgi:hypothetical protein